MANHLSNPVFADADAARAWLEAHLWPDGPICPHCGTVGNATALPTRAGWYQCNASECRSQFTVTVGTVFERSHIPLNKWLMAAYLICCSKKGISAHQIHRILGITYKSAWFMVHRIRAAMDPFHNAQPTPTMGGADKIIEADETVLARSVKTKKRASQKNIVVMALVERGGEVRSFPIDHADSSTLKLVITSNVRKESRHYTDGRMGYRSNAMGLDGGHDWVDHSKKEYVRGDVHVNTAEGIFSLFKRGMVGTYQHCGEQHLHRYLAEFDFRYNGRAALGIDDKTRAENLLKGIVGKRLTYRRIGGREEAET
jgi:transposase-like protein